MKGNIVITRVFVVPVRPPIGALQVHLHRAPGERAVLAELEQSALEVGPAPCRPLASVDNGDGSSLAVPHWAAQVNLLVPQGGEDGLSYAALLILGFGARRYAHWLLHRR